MVVVVMVEEEIGCIIEVGLNTGTILYAKTRGPALHYLFNKQIARSKVVSECNARRMNQCDFQWSVLSLLCSDANLLTHVH